MGHVADVVQEREDVFTAARESEEGQEQADGVVVRVVVAGGGGVDVAEAEELGGDSLDAGEGDEVHGAVFVGGFERDAEDLAVGVVVERGQDRVDAGADVEPLEVGGRGGHGPGVFGRERVDGAEGDAGDECGGDEDGVGVFGGEVVAG